MFIYSLRASTLKFLGIVGVALAALITLIVFIPSDHPRTAAVAETAVYHYDKIKTADTITQLTGLPVLGQVPVYSVRKPEDGPSRRLSPERNDTV